MVHRSRSPMLSQKTVPPAPTQTSSSSTAAGSCAPKAPRLLQAYPNPQALTLLLLLAPVPGSWGWEAATAAASRHPGHGPQPCTSYSSSNSMVTALQRRSTGSKQVQTTFSMACSHTATEAPTLRAAPGAQANLQQSVQLLSSSSSSSRWQLSTQGAQFCSMNSTANSSPCSSQAYMTPAQAQQGFRTCRTASSSYACRDLCMTHLSTGTHQHQRCPSTCRTATLSRQLTTHTTAAAAHHHTATATACQQAAQRQVRRQVSPPQQQPQQQQRQRLRRLR